MTALLFAPIGGASVVAGQLGASLFGTQRFGDWALGLPNAAFAWLCCLLSYLDRLRTLDFGGCPACLCLLGGEGDYDMPLARLWAGWPLGGRIYIGLLPFGEFEFL